MELNVTSSAFTAGAAIPRRYTCDGENISPPLAWAGAPAATRSYAIIVDDPDAPHGTWVHWVAWNLPAERTELVPGGALGGKAVQGTGTGKGIGYEGPCPPPGPSHRYYFKIYALDTPLDLPAGATKAELEQAMHGHILAQGQVMGTYGR